MKKVFKCGLFLFSFIVSFQAVNAQKKKEIIMINNSLIYDLFMNYELSERNGNVATIVDFFPKTSFKEFKKVEVKSNAGGEKGVSNFYYNVKGSIEKVTYSKNGRIYTYDFIYNGKNLAYVNIANKKKIEFFYDKKGKLTTIKRFKSGRVFEYNFEYLEAENKFNIKLVVEYDGKRKASKNNYYVVLNKNYKLTDIRIDVYVKKEIKYNKAGDILTSSFARVDKDNVEFGWEYKELDNKGNWLERSFKKNVFQRQIEYL